MPNLDPTALLMFLPSLGPMELIIILVIVILIFGVNKIPQLGKGLGEGIRNFKSSIKSISEDSDEKAEDKTKEEKQ
ncbi:MAG: twin-arginine translocase TatA/TatE family subunit [Acidobacteriota bacterium]|jgi:sec-independent protein translocase protein TatA